VLGQLATELRALREQALADETELADTLHDVHPRNLRSARNLVHYLSLRRHDLRDLQVRLARAGLSSLGRSEAHVLVTIDRVLEMLALACHTAAPEYPPAPVGFRQGERILAANTRRLLGAHSAHRAVRLVVTLPTEAPEDPRVIHDLVRAGMNCARINCARDDEAVWGAMAKHVRAAERAYDRDCRILVDLAGQKPRTGAVAGGAKRLPLSVGDRFEARARDAGAADTRAFSAPDCMHRAGRASARNARPADLVR
jgi:pyruvate kinase